jgi:hypothetical protein
VGPEAVLVFLHLGSRKLFVTEFTRKPNATWMKEQAGNSSST